MKNPKEADLQDYLQSAMELSEKGVIYMVRIWVRNARIVRVERQVKVWIRLRRRYMTSRNWARRVLRSVTSHQQDPPATSNILYSQQQHHRMPLAQKTQPHPRAIISRSANIMLDPLAPSPPPLPLSVSWHSASTPHPTPSPSPSRPSSVSPPQQTERTRRRRAGIDVVGR